METVLDKFLISILFIALLIFMYKDTIFEPLQKINLPPINRKGKIVDIKFSNKVFDRQIMDKSNELFI